VAFAIGFSLLIVRSLAYRIPARRPWSGADALRSGIYGSTVTAAVAMVAFLWSYLAIPPGRLSGEGYYEFLFWGGGHIIQFTHTVLMLVAWLVLAQASGATPRLAPRTTAILLWLVVAPVAGAPLIYLAYDVVSPEHRLTFTTLMKYGGLTSLPLGLVVGWSLLTAGRAPVPERPVRAALLTSIALFAAGGVIGFLIQGVNVVIPAHYHGSIVGVTLAFMGLTYYLLPRFGYRKPTSRLAHAQPYVYGGGQLLHILGLAWSGGYGVQRKTAGSAQGLENLPEIAGMALMGLGGLIAIIGGLLFLVVAIRAMWPEKG